MSRGETSLKTAVVSSWTQKHVNSAAMNIRACGSCQISVFNFLQLSTRKWNCCIICYFLGFPGGSDGKESTCNVGDLGSIPDWEDPLEEGMATHSSILAWRIPWTEEPGGLQPIRSRTVGQDRAHAESKRLKSLLDFPVLFHQRVPNCSFCRCSLHLFTKGVGGLCFPVSVLPQGWWEAVNISNGFCSFQTPGSTTTSWPLGSLLWW